MDELLSEKEQIEKMRAWWSEYGYYVIGGVVLGALILFGFNYYQTAQRDAQIAASTLYDTLTLNVADGDLEAAEATAAEIASGHGNTSYAAQSKLAMARLYMDKNRDQDAVDTLQGLLTMKGFENLKHVGRVRLAKVLLYQDKAEEVVTLLEGYESSAFAARYADALGDAYVASGRFADARASYEAALRETMPTVDQGLVQLKLLDLPDEATATEEPVEDSGVEPDMNADDADDVAEGSAE